MRWLITGGCGFIGRALVTQLVKEGGHTVRVLDNMSAGSRQAFAAVTGYRETPAHDARAMSDMFESGSVEMIDGDIRNMALTLRAAEGAETIVHLAAAPGMTASTIEPRFDIETTVAGTLNLLEAARYCDARRFVFASSNAAHGEYRTGGNAAAAPSPASPFGAAKLAAEAYCTAYAASFGVPAVSLRLGCVYGPGNGAGVVGRFIAGALKGGTIEICGDGRQLHDFLFIDDVAEAFRLAADPAGSEEIAAGATYQVSGGEETSVAELLDLLRRLAKHAGAPAAQIVHRPAATGAVMSGYPRTAGQPPLPGWSPTTDLASALGRTLRAAVENLASRSAAA
jgi:UDP-glucose 4-epimerase